MNAIENNSVSLIKADNYTVNFGHRISTPPPTPITGTSSISPLTGAAASHLDDFPEETITQLKKRITEIVSEKFTPEEHVKSREAQLFRFYFPHSILPSFEENRGSKEIINNLMHKAPEGRKEIVASYITQRKHKGCPITDDSILFPATRVMNLQHITTPANDNGYHWISSSPETTPIENRLISPTGIFAGTWGSHSKLSTFFPKTIFDKETLLTELHKASPISGAVCDQRTLSQSSTNPNILIEFVRHPKLPNHFLTAFPILANINLEKEKTNRLIHLYTNEDSEETVQMFSEDILALSIKILNKHSSKINDLNEKIAQMRYEVDLYAAQIEKQEKLVRQIFPKAQALICEAFKLLPQGSLEKFKLEQIKSPSIEGLKELLSQKKTEESLLNILKKNKKTLENNLLPLELENKNLELQNPIRYDLDNSVIIDIASGLNSSIRLKGIYVTCSKKQLSTGILDDSLTT